MRIIDDIEVSPNKIIKWANYYFDWLSFNTRSIEPMAHNMDNLVKAQYHEEIGRNGYFTPESGTSEGQFLSILGLLAMYEATKKMKWLGMAEKLIESAFKYLYKNCKFPKDYKFSELNTYIPHWLFNVSKDFISEAYYTKKIKVENGKGSIKTKYEARKVFKAFTINAKLAWDDPYASIVPKDTTVSEKDVFEYEISNWIVDENEISIRLKDNITDTIIVVYSDMGGPVIKPSENYEAYPIWRPLKEGETDAAVDSLWWSYFCWKKLYSITKSERYRLLVDHTQNVLKRTCQLSDVEQYFGAAFNLTEDESQDGILINKDNTYKDSSNRIPEPKWNRNAEDGSIEIMIEEGIGSILLGAKIDRDTNYDDRYYEMLVEAGTRTAIVLKIKCLNAAGVIKEFSYGQIAKGPLFDEVTGELLNEYEAEVLKYPINKFKDVSKCEFDLLYSPHAELIYKSDNCNVIFSEVKLEEGLARKVDFLVGTEYDTEGNAYAGYAQYHPSMRSRTFNEIPKITYSSSGCIEITFFDEAGWKWAKALPASEKLITVSLDKSDFYLYEIQENGFIDVPNTPVGELNTLLFCGISKTSQLTLLRLGTIEDAEFNTVTYTTNIDIEITEEKPQTFKLHYLRPLPIKDYKYSPYIFPFTMNTVNGVINSWRGTPYAGYQCPWFWQDVGDEKGTNINLKFLKDAQIEYSKRLKNGYNFFMPCFIWDRWDNLEYGKPNTFTFIGPDPNTSWGGYQYRAITNVALALMNEPQNKTAKNIVYNFFMSLNKVWKSGKESPPTNFNPDGSVTTQDGLDLHGVALILRAAVYAYQSCAISDGICLSLINKCLMFMDINFQFPTDRGDYNKESTIGTWRNDGIWYQFHGGEILHALGELLKYVPNKMYLKSSNYRYTIDTMPKAFGITSKDYVEIQTPSGPQIAELVAMDDKYATDLLVQTDSGIKSVKGGEEMSVYDFNLIKKSVGKVPIDIDLKNEVTMLYKSQIGCIAFLGIKARSKTVNISPRRSYDYSTGLYTNMFFLSSSKEYTICFKASGSGSVVLAFTENKTDGTQNSTVFLNGGMPVKNGDSIQYKFKTDELHSYITIYPPNGENTLILNNIMLFEGNIPNNPGSYIENEIECFTKDVVISTKNVNGKYTDICNLKDYISDECLPLRTKGTIYDEITVDSVIKRIDENGEILDEEKVYELEKPLPILACGQDTWIVVESDGIAPDITLSYPVLFKDAYDITINGSPILNNSLCGTFKLNEQQVSDK
ncbi:hypothetical protein [Clostridium sp. BJN0001]|uniref:hypothetical protein n=1 Tax=Clostridium sp. BJN0001 TaxID=2930219 RepID=UPI001FD14302|nr:hypothetical protein [Clostridium sp. BJN0001]